MRGTGTDPARLPATRAQAGRFRDLGPGVDRWAVDPYAPRPARRFMPGWPKTPARFVSRDVMSSRPARARRADGRAPGLLGGFFSGEGCFGLSGLQPRAVVHLRRDDRAILELFAARFGVGTVRDRAPYRRGNAGVVWLICARRTARGGAPLRGRRLRGRKRREFEVWRHAAEERGFARLAGRRWDRARVRHVAVRLAAMRVYCGPTSPGAAGAADAADHARRAYVDVLRAFADETPDGTLTCTAYTRARAGHPEWPTRNTLTGAFGSWEQALAAAGLSARAGPWRRARAAPVSGRGER